MSHAEKFPVTPALRFLRARNAVFEGHLYEYVEKGGTAVSSVALGVDEHAVVKTLVMEDDARRPLIVLMHGDRQVSTKELARVLGQKRITPCTPESAEHHTGYVVGGTSPFATRKTLPIYIEETILELPRLYINGGKRGFLVSMAPKELMRLVTAKPVKVAIL
jgi:Cys-tRNA(Pro) deacylase